jgi:hypothetical protein
MDKTKVLLLVVCAALAGVVVWQHSADVAMVSPAALQLIKPAEPAAPVPPAASVAPASSMATGTPAAPAPGPSTTARSKPAPRADVRPAAPVASTAARSESITPAPAAALAPPSAPVAEKSGEAAAFEEQAILRMHQGEYHQAAELFDSALRNGGKATFTIVHDHSKGNFEKDPKASCVGELVLTPNAITFDGAGAGDSHHFEASWADVMDAGANRFFGSGLGGFHVAINPDGKYKNFNLAPRSKDKFEAKLIVDLLNANARKADRGK